MKQTMVFKNNKKNLEQLEYVPDCDILVLPEMWNCPYHNDILKDSYLLHDESLDALISIAKTKKIWVIGGSISYKENNHIYNRCYIIDASGNIVCTYDKTHLFELNTDTIYAEKDIFTPGNQFHTFDTPWSKMGILLCYDIRFPEVSRLLTQNGATILFCPAAFNEHATKNHWKLFTSIRALENEVYFCGVAPAKYTYKSYTSGGHSILVSPFGKTLYEMDDKADTKVIDIDFKQVQNARKRMPFWDIRRNDLYNLKENKNERNSNH